MPYQLTIWLFFDLIKWNEQMNLKSVSILILLAVVCYNQHSKCRSHSSSLFILENRNIKTSVIDNNISDWNFSWNDYSGIF